jgi:hypothetical protein
MFARIFLLFALAGPAAASEPRLMPTLGFAWLERGTAGQRTNASGVALELRLEGRPTGSRVGYGVTFGWGLTDWDRAREWIDAGNRAGSWTTDRFADVEAWVSEGRRNDTQGLRFLAAIFADVFLALTYVAVPVCYVGSVGGATSHLQLDATGAFHLADADGPNDAWIELGGGAATLPERTSGPDSRFAGWRRAAGPVVGVGARFGVLRLGARMLLSPPALNTSSYGGTVLAGSMTVGLVR